MDSMSAFARGEASRGAPLRVFDWRKAAQLIKERHPRVASAGLEDDWDWTGGIIYTADGIPDQDDTYTFLASTWATPQLDLDGDVIDCWVWAEGTGWDSHTFWPSEALKIL